MSQDAIRLDIADKLAREMLEHIGQGNFLRGLSKLTMTASRNPVEISLAKSPPEMLRRDMAQLQSEYCALVANIAANIERELSQRQNPRP
jgi:hypothetical protein